jgi:hypothetical protein
MGHAAGHQKNAETGDNLLDFHDGSPKRFDSMNALFAALWTFSLNIVYEKSQDEYR